MPIEEKKTVSKAGHNFLLENRERMSVSGCGMTEAKDQNREKLRASQGQLRGRARSRAGVWREGAHRAEPGLGCSDIIIFFIRRGVRLGSMGPCVKGRFRSARGPVIAPAEQGQS